MLVIDENEAPTVRRIYDLALGRAGMPVGVKAIVNRLNAASDQHRGKPFHILSVHSILTATTYADAHNFNRREARTSREKATAQWISVPVHPSSPGPSLNRCRPACTPAAANACCRAWSAMITHESIARLAGAMRKALRKDDPDFRKLGSACDGRPLVPEWSKRCSN